MIKYFVAFGCLICMIVLDTQKVRYAFRTRDFITVSETNNIYVSNITIAQIEAEHKLSFDFNITRDVRIKAIHVVINRCRFDKSACENFQVWKIKDNLKVFVDMKNQIWTPFLDAMSPRVEFPVIKKNIYKVRNLTLSADAIVLFYPEATKYYWIGRISAFDVNDKRAIDTTFEFSIFEYVERIRKPRSKNRNI